MLASAAEASSTRQEQVHADPRTGSLPPKHTEGHGRGHTGLVGHGGVLCESRDGDGDGARPPGWHRARWGRDVSLYPYAFALSSRQKQEGSTKNVGNFGERIVQNFGSGMTKCFLYITKNY